MGEVNNEQEIGKRTMIVSGSFGNGGESYSLRSVSADDVNGHGKIEENKFSKKDLQEARVSASSLDKQFIKF